MTQGLRGGASRSTVRSIRCGEEGMELTQGLDTAHPVWMGVGGRGLKDVTCQGLGVANCQDEPGSSPGLKAVTVLAAPRSLLLASP